MLTSGAFGYLMDYLVAWVIGLSLIIHTWCFFRCFPRQTYKKTGLVLGNVLVFASLLGVVAIAAESYLRFVYIATDSFGMSLPARRWFVIHTTLNSLGCRDREWPTEKPPGIRRVAFVGDSFTYGWGIENPDDRFPDHIQSKFDHRAPKAVEVMNVAKAGWDTGAQIQPVKDMISVYGVDEIVLCYVPNDIEKLLPIQEDFNPIRPPAPTWFNLESSCLLDYLYRRVYLPRVPTVAQYHDWLAAGFASEPFWQKHQQQLDEMISFCRSRRVTFRVVLLPFLLTRGEKFQTSQIHAMLRRFFESRDVPVVDLYPVIQNIPPAQLVVNRQDAHPNEEAQALFADAIWNAFYAPP